MFRPELIDLSRDPVILLAALPVGHADRVAAYHQALEWLIVRSVPFVLVTRADDPGQAESHADQRARALWFKAHAAALAAVCRGFVYVEPDADCRMIWEARAKAMAGSFPVPMVIAADRPQAIAAASQFVAG